MTADARSHDELMQEANKFNYFFANVGRKTFEKSRENQDHELQNEVIF